MAVFEIEATITKRGQTTVPAAIRRALKIGPEGGIIYRLEEDGSVTLAKKEVEATDPVIQNFLAFLAADMVARPEALQPVSMEWLRESQDLVKDVSVDLDAPLDPSDEG
jgi:antitoxin PrlF